MKARHLGLPTSEHRQALAVTRGCRYYGGTHLPQIAAISRELLTDEELAIALLSVAAAYEPQAIRLGRQCLGRRESIKRRL